jgi:ceramide glucosyltransferase
MHIFFFFRWTILLLALSPFAFYLLVLYSARRFFGKRPAEPPADFTPPLSVLKPVRGLDRDAYKNFASFCTQNYPAEYEILFCVPEEDDPAVPVIRQIIQDFPDRQIRLFFGFEPLGTNLKVNKLVRMVKEARHDILVVSDSDIWVEPYYLTSVARLFRDPEVGAVTCPYRGWAGNSFASELEVMGNSTEFQPGVLVAWLLEGVKFTLGATMAVRRKALEDIGGFESLADHYSDDFETGNRIAAKGWKVELNRWPIVTVFPKQTLAECFRHQVRWALTTRHSRPAGHIGLGLTFGLPWSIAAALVAPSWPVAAAYLGAYVVLRFAVAWQVGVVGLQDNVLKRNLWWLPARDVFGLIVWVSSFFKRRIIWRGSPYYVRNQRLVPAGRS